MKSFTALILAASAALTTAQVTINPNGTFTCAIADAVYCAGDSLTTNIIIRCTGTVGQAGNCDDNLDGEVPFGLSYAPCWEKSATAGIAACSKNCIVYGGSGNYNGTFTLPDCTPSTTVTSSTTSAVSRSHTSSVITSSTAPVTSYTTIVTLGTTITVPCSSSISTSVATSLSTTTPRTVIPFSSAPTGGVSSPAGNGTATIVISSSQGSSATATPVGPTTSAPASFTGAAMANQAGAVLVAGGLLMAYFL